MSQLEITASRVTAKDRINLTLVVMDERGAILGEERLPPIQLPKGYRYIGGDTFCLRIDP